MTASGTYNFNPSVVDIVLDAFDRLRIRPSAITADHLFSAKRSINQVLSRWSNRGVNLWATDEQTHIVTSAQEYNCPAGTVAVMEVFLRTYSLGAAADLTIDLSTTNGSDLVTVGYANHGLAANQWVSIPVPIAIGGLVIQGFYRVYDVPGTDTFRIQASGDATSSVANGGSVPSYTTVAADATVTATLTSHGYVAGETWTVHVSTDVGGLTLLGDYVITEVTANTLTFEAANAAGSSETVSENEGEMQVALGDGTNPRDSLLSPISRQEWAAFPDKFQTGIPSMYWFDRQISPSLILWPVPDLSAPMELRYFRMRQLQDANPQNLETPDLPYRFEEAFCAALTSSLAIKWGDPELIPGLIAYEKDTWAEAAAEDRERVTLNVSPNLGGYFS